jgi:hypothetical protein
VNTYYPPVFETSHKIATIASSKYLYLNLNDPYTNYAYTYFGVYDLTDKSTWKSSSPAVLSKSTDTIYTPIALTADENYLVTVYNQGTV